MHRLDSYINALEPWLPGSQREEEILEIQGNLWSRLECEEKAANTQMDDAGCKAFVESLPHPLMAAYPYWPQQNLIDPILLPVAARLINITSRRYFLPISAVWALCLIIALWCGLSPSAGDILAATRPILVPAILLVASLALANTLLVIFHRSQPISNSI